MQLPELNNKIHEAFSEKFKPDNCPKCGEKNGLEAQKMQWAGKKLYEPCKKCGHEE